MQLFLLTALITFDIHPAVELEFATEEGKAYQVQRAMNAGGPDWEDIKGPVPGTGKPRSVFFRQGEKQAFFRVVELEGGDNGGDDTRNPANTGNPANSEDGADNGDDGDDGGNGGSGSNGDDGSSGSNSGNGGDQGEVFTGFMKLRGGDPIGGLMQEGEGLLDAARFLADTTPDLEVKEVEVQVIDDE